MVPYLFRQYLYDAAGNITRDNENGTVTDFAYDPFNRLRTASGGYSATYTYDAIHNLTTKTEGGTTYTLTYPGSRAVRPHTPTSVGSWVYAYDANGNVTN